MFHQCRINRRMIEEKFSTLNFQYYEKDSLLGVRQKYNNDNKKKKKKKKKSESISDKGPCAFLQHSMLLLLFKTIHRF